MKASEFEKQLKNFKPFTSAAYTYAEETQSEQNWSILPAKKLHFYFNINGRNLDRIQVDDENNNKVTTIAVINKRHPFDFSLNPEFWMFVPENKQKGLYMLIATLAATPIQDREELSDYETSKAYDDQESQLIEALADYIQNLQPEEDEDEDDDDAYDIYSWEDNDQDATDDEPEEDIPVEINDDISESIHDTPLENTSSLKDQLAQLKKSANEDPFPEPLEEQIWDEIVEELKEYALHENQAGIIYDNVLEEMADKGKIELNDYLYSFIKKHIFQLNKFIIHKCEEEELSYRLITINDNEQPHGLIIQW